MGALNLMGALNKKERFKNITNCVSVVISAE